MKIKILVFFLFIMIAPSVTAKGEKGMYFKNQKRSLIDWENLKIEEWLDFKHFISMQNLKDKQPEWERILQEKSKHEIMGRVIDCIGTCRLHVGMGFNNTQYKSTLREGDEFTTVGNSYAWIYLLDGTLVRLAPSSSITLKEINIGPTEVFLHARINFGNVTWLSRDKNSLIEHNLRETDTYFLPLSLYEANRFLKDERSKNFDEGNLFSILDQSDDNLDHLKYLNKLVEENNAFTKKKTYSFLVTPSGTVSGYDLMMEFIILVGNNSYFKKRSKRFQGYSGELDNSDALFYYRGFENKLTTKLDDDVWMEIEKNGRSLKVYDLPQKFSFGELMSKRVTTLMIAREIFLKRYSRSLLKELDPISLASLFGYRQWGDFNIDGKKMNSSEMGQRLDFLVEYTRRLETFNILNANKLKKKLMDRGEKLIFSEYSNRFYKTAFDAYLSNRGMNKAENSDRVILNSTTKKMWKMINASK